MIEMVNELVGGMVKMSIEKWSDKPSQFSSDTFYLMLNPETYSEEFKIEYLSPKSCHDKKDPKVALTHSDQYAFDFILDGTGATGIKIDVDTKIRQFKELVTGSGEAGKKNYLRLRWGTLQLKCLFNTAKVQYTFFSRTGKPLRAKLSVSFKGVHTGDSSVLSQADQLISKKIGAGQNIAQVATKAYGNARKLASLAQHNNLNSFRKIPVGTNLLFPPKALL